MIWPSSFNKGTVSSSSSSNALLCLKRSVQDWECCGWRTPFLSLEANFIFSRLLSENQEDDLDEEDEKEELKDEADEESEEEEAKLVEVSEPVDEEHEDDDEDEKEEHMEEPADDMELVDVF